MSSCTWGSIRRCKSSAVVHTPLGTETCTTCPSRIDPSQACRYDTPACHSGCNVSSSRNSTQHIILYRGNTSNSCEWTSVPAAGADIDGNSLWPWQSPLCRTRWPGRVKNSNGTQQTKLPHPIPVSLTASVIWNSLRTIYAHFPSPKAVSVRPNNHLFQQAYNLWESCV